MRHQAATSKRSRREQGRGKLERPDVSEGILVAGLGNMFFRDDGFGPEVVRRLASTHPELPGVRVVDYGIRGMHLAYDLLGGYSALVIVDALPHGTDPGAPTPSAPATSTPTA